MAIKTHYLAFDTLLLMVASTFIIVGLSGLGVGMVADLHSPLYVLLVPDGYLAVLLGGISLMAMLQGCTRLRWLAGGALVALGLYSLAHNHLAGGSQVGESWLAGGLRITSPAAVLLILVSSCLMLGTCTPRRRMLWLASGVLLCLVGVLVALGWLLAPQSPYVQHLFSSSPVVVVLLALLFGAAMLVAGSRTSEQHYKLFLGRLVVMASLAGVAISSLAWFMLSWQQEQALHHEAEQLIDNIQLNAEQVMASRLTLMRRMAQRLDAAEGQLEQRVLDRDVQSYLEDASSLQAIGLLDSDNRWQWGWARDNDDWRWLGAQLSDPVVGDWLAMPFDSPRMMVPEADTPGMALMVIGVPSHQQQLVTMLDISQLLSSQLRVQMGALRVVVSRRGEPMTEFQQPGYQAENQPLIPHLLSRRHIGLPGGVMLTVEAYPASQRGLLLASLMPTGVASAGLTLSWLLAFSLGLVNLVMARSRALVEARQTLWESEQRYRSLFAYHPDAVFSLDLSGHFVAANRTCSQITGYGIEEIIGLHFATFVHPHEMPRIQGYFEAASRGEIPHYELEIVDRDGNRHTLDLLNLPIIVDGQVRGVYGIAKDVTERRAQETRLRLLERSVEASVNGVVVADALRGDMPIIYANPAFMAMTGYTEAEVMGRNCRFLQGDDTDPEAVRIIRDHLARHQEVHVTLCNYRRDGSPFWNDLYISPVRDGDGVVTHYVAVQHDISEHKAYEARLAYHASHDALTGLVNRTLFEDRLAHDFALAKRHSDLLAVLFVDLDDFKPINDTLGHAVGDQLLVEVARRLKSVVRAGDTVARLGGDEFVILLPELHHEEQTLEVVERLLPVVARPYTIKCHELHLTCSVGIAVSTPEMTEPQELIQQADMAMYQAKQQGRNAYQWFTREITDRLGERVSLRNDLQEAIENERFELHYQPLIDRHGEVCGVEALLRWKHHEKGYISPAVFIPLAESTGQIMPISRWVLERACRDMVSLADQGVARLRVSVNLSPLQFHRTNFLTNLRQTLQQTGLAPDMLELELTEGILMNDTELAIDILHALRSMQVGVSIDDFGTGFSSLSYLRHLPISKVKIDRSFINDVTTSGHDAAIVQGIISMAHHLGLEVVAEGIETHDQHQRLTEYGCDIFQGFLLARPMPLDRLIAFINRRQPA
ncbi:putative bifunctional diguanylate cyclase/phosphodiesterase [Halomonas urumqiensis]|uniref:cyclic-guanylate-specific phosphodiesterase n=1 Tax=Halomonas urumqiensis TaxID=1684789 RepID=A0A2N7UK75_9GAMM|nr:EAL domain-containing protein [Halomonas urumqiensis]PMR80844.1 phosphodiesterase [Halomonas urumqiensis]PTB02801.1 PAS domain S-box protein [Halomonas urumqiensis]GHE21308.1 hypothetical protein GCM10017767_18290 [Halomonas urumqiensis]